MKKKICVIIFAWTTLASLYGAGNGQASVISNESQLEEPLWDAFGGQDAITISNEPRIQTIDFTNPPKPSRLEVLMRRIGIPIFLRYVQFYNWVRRCVYWMRARVVRAFSRVRPSNYHAHKA